MAKQMILVPDIGEYADIPVIEVLVKVGERIEKEQALLVLESDKATMEVPADVAGTITSLVIKLGDKVSKGSVIAEIEVADSAAPIGVSQPAPQPAAQVSPAVAIPSTPPVTALNQYSGKVDHECEVLVLGAGPGGYSAAFRSADLGMNTILVERFATLGGVCLNVGCIPSKALLHTTAVMDEVKTMSHHGITYGEPVIDMNQLRAYKDGVIAKLTGGLAGMAKARKVKVVRGLGRFLDANHVEVEMTNGEGQEPTGQKEVIRFQKAIIAVGSQPVKLPFLPVDPRIVDSTGALLLKSIPKRMLVIGGGIIGLEMATVYSTLGARIDIAEMLDGLMAGADRDLEKVWEKFNSGRFERVMLKTRATKAQVTDKGIEVTFEGENAPAEPQTYDLVLVAVGRSPNGKKISAAAAGIDVDERGFISVDRQMRTNVPNIFAIGDLIGQPMLAHKAVHEGHVAAEAAAGHKSYFDAKQIPSVAYTDPEVAWAGMTEEQCKAQGIAYEKGLFPWAASGRAIANGRDEGFTKLIFDATSKRIIGGGIVGTHAGDLIGEVCLAIEMGADAVDIGKTIHPHPTLGESVGLAAEAALGHCTDLPPVKKKAH
ncbi:dihydrolipoamide dehydrogenase [Polynucleobacter meluiroseus]|uniref:Dihydrolipoyl dehydrogenase n=1 Tax=Polynucleobacter meluiroseus TaxID=1938814 RepID=A0A240E1Z1_9BURK|nr:dihydrolipoyl dehydrogenase [Polynucleobacter meluiroseus]SNX28496.1 dihydrolipoamide dehydrogenase [Polynucleobacter meluiroseus]